MLDLSRLSHDTSAALVLSRPWALHIRELLPLDGDQQRECKADIRPSNSHGERQMKPVVGQSLMRDAASRVFVDGLPKQCLTSPSLLRPFILHSSGPLGSFSWLFILYYITQSLLEAGPQLCSSHSQLVALGVTLH